MMRSHISMTRPSVISLYLFTMAAMMSVPPVLPLYDKANPTPVPQKEAPMTHEKEMQRRRYAKMKLQQSIDNGLLLSLCNERDRAAIQNRLKEQHILKNRLDFQKMTWQQGRKKLANARLRAEQQSRSSILFKEKEYWRILCINIVFWSLVVLFIIYILNYYFTRKRLRREKEKAEKSEHIKSLFFQNMNHANVVEMGSFAFNDTA